MKSIQYRLYPNTEQQNALSHAFGCVRYVWNWALGIRNEAYEYGGVSLNYNDTQEALPALKTEMEWLKEAPSQALQYSLRNLDTAYKNFFTKRTGFPSFKKKSSKQALSFPQGVSVEEQTITLPKIGNVLAVIHRQFEGKIKTVTVTKRASGKYFASVLIDDGIADLLAFPVTAEGLIGVDLGIKTFATYSDGTTIENPKFFRRTRKKVARAVRQHSRKKKGSNNRERARVRLARLREKETNKRNDFLHKLTANLVRENQAIAIEDLNVSGMVQNSRLAVSISEVAFGEFRRQLEYKARWAGKTVYVIGRFYPSSKTCNHCGRINPNLTLSDRSWECDCGEIVERDFNAALNIRDEAIKQFVGTDCAKVTLGESVVRKTPRGTKNQKPSALADGVVTKQAPERLT